MRKTLSIVLSIVMVLSLAVVGISAAEATEIKTAEEFAAMAADGNYKLAADIAIDASYATAFTGTFDGDGHTVTVSVPAFSTITGATISNLTIKGTVSGTGNTGALAATGNGGFKITNVTNNADVSSSGESAYVGGLVGAVSTGSATADSYAYNEFTNCTNNGKISAGSMTPRVGGIAGNNAKYAYTTYTNCVNNGALTVAQIDDVTALTGSPYLGGISASTFGGKYVNCINKGNITSSIAAHGGGIVGRTSPSSQKADQSVIIESCTNEGSVTANSGGIGGIIGYGGTKFTDDAHGTYTVTKCVNKGNITIDSDSGNAGGIVGYVYGQSYTEGKKIYQYAILTDCVNYGTVTSKGAYTSQLIGYTNAVSTTVTGCVGLGKIVNTSADKSVVVGLSSADIQKYNYSNNILVENDGTSMYSYAADETNAANRVAIADRPAGTVEFKSAADCQTAVAALGTIGYVAPSSPVTPSTGDNAVWFALAGIVALLGTAVAAKKENA